MAHTYTTARGKTKKAKEGIRKDSKNNAATKLMSKISKNSPAAQENVPIHKDFFNKLKLTGSGGDKATRTQIMSTSAADAASNGEHTVSQAIRNIRIQLPSYQRCFYTECAGTPHAVYKHCAQCRIARYCSPECQKLDWRKLHKSSCTKTDVLTPGVSVAIRPLETYSSFLPPSLYPSDLCKPPCNEFHGVIVSVSETNQVATVEIFDADLIPVKDGGVQIDVALKDMVASGWRLDDERKIAGEKHKRKEEQKKQEEERKTILEEEEKISEEKKKAKEERIRLQKEKRMAEIQQKAGEGVAVDWGLFADDIDDIEDIDEEGL